MSLEQRFEIRSSFVHITAAPLERCLLMALHECFFIVCYACRPLFACGQLSLACIFS
jgi:hypothetical protein